MVGCDLASGPWRSHEQTSPAVAISENRRSLTGSARAANADASSSASADARGVAMTGVQHASRLRTAICFAGMATSPIDNHRSVLQHATLTTINLQESPCL